MSIIQYSAETKYKSVHVVRNGVVISNDTRETAKYDYSVSIHSVDSSVLEKFVDWIRMTS